MQLQGPPSQASFLCPLTQAANDAEAIRAETIRRIEVHVLCFLHSIGAREAGVAKTKKAAAAAVAAAGARVSLKALRDEFLVLHLLANNVRCGVTATQRDVYYHLVRDVADQTVVNAAIQRLVGRLQVPRQLLGVVAGARGGVAGSLSYRNLSLLSCGPDGACIPTLEEDLRVRPRHVPRAEEKDAAGDLREGRKQVEDVLESGAAPFLLHENTRFILVIEKHAVFHRLMEERLPHRLPCVLLSAHGFPTHAARTLLHNMHAAAPELPVVGLADYNPSGLGILLQYKWGSLPRSGWRMATHTVGQAAKEAKPRGMHENRYNNVPALRWLGLRGIHFGLHRANPIHPAHGRADENAVCFPERGRHCRSGDGTPLPLPDGLPRQRFSARDAAVMRNLLAALTSAQTSGVGDSDDRADAGASCTSWVSEAALMAQAGVKVEIEAMYTRGSLWVDPLQDTAAPFGEWVCQRLLRHDYI